MLLNRVSATKLEEKIMEIDKICVVIRCSRDEIFNEYPYKNKATATTSIMEWYNNRLKPIIGEYDAEIIDGKGTKPHRGSNIETVRNSYTK